jgi:hypothetical protein
MIYDFMIALASNPSTHDLISSENAENEPVDLYEAHEAIYLIAVNLANQYANEYLRSQE